MRKSLVYKAVPKAQYSSAVGLEGISVPQSPEMGMRTAALTTPTGTGSKPPKNPNKSGVGVGAITGAFSTAVGMAQPFINDWQNKKAEKKMEVGYAERGLMNDKEFEIEGKKVAATMNALENKSFGNLYGGMKKGGLIYQYGGMMPATEEAVKAQAAEGYGVSKTYTNTTPGATVNTVEMTPNTPVQKRVIGWNQDYDETTPLTSIDDTPSREGVNNSQLRTHRRGIFRGVGNKRTRKVNFLDKMFQPSKYSQTSKEADKVGYKPGF